MIDASCSQQSFQSPEKALESLDPTLREVMQRWKASFKKDLSHLATQTELREKYQKILDDNAIMKQFQQEAQRQWQWPNEYLSVATPVLGIDPAADSDSIYDLNAAWEAIRKRHALECQSFIIEHQKRTLQFFVQKVDSGRVCQHVSDLYEDWKGKCGNFLTAEASLHTQNVCKSFMELVIRHELPRMKSRLSEAAEARKQQASALLDAETRFQSMEPHMLIALIELDKHAVQVSKADGVKAKRVELQKSSQLAALVRKFPEQNTLRSSSHIETPGSPPLQDARQHRTQKVVAAQDPRRRDLQDTHVDDPNDPTVLRPDSLLHSRASSGRSSQGSSNSQTHWKGKGKGKAKGHPRSKGKGRGNMYRERGDVPKSITKKTVSFKGSRHS